MPQRIFLIGLMGAGKTTVGRQLAKIMGLSFYDSDREIEVKTGVDILRIFDVEGETGFRERERKVIDELTAKDNIVLATGGGAILDSKSRHFLSSRGMVVYLRASADQLYKRTCNTEKKHKEQKRPLLMTEDPKAKLEELLKIREPLYIETANLVINTDKITINKIIKEIKAGISDENINNKNSFAAD